MQGLGYDRHGFGPLPGLLAGDFRVLVFDNRGVGDSDVPKGPYSVPMMAADAIAVLDAAGVDSAHVLGVSLGGFIAQELALSHPERVRKLVLCSTAPGVQPPCHPMPERGSRPSPRSRPWSARQASGSWSRTRSATTACATPGARGGDPPLPARPGPDPGRLAGAGLRGSDLRRVRAIPAIEAPTS